MKKWIPMLLVSASWPALTAATDQPDTAALQQEARQITQQFGGQLKSLLQAAMASGGPVNAMQVCKVNAPQIADTASKDSGWKVARTASRVRNPANQPDPWEQQVLQDWARQMAGGTAVEQLQPATMISAAEYRFMQPIATADLCVKCHGTELAPEVRATLTELYPQDQATGFKAGDLRGAFSLRKPL